MAQERLYSCQYSQTGELRHLNYRGYPLWMYTFHSDILYNTQEELVDRLSAILQNHHRFQKTGEEISMLMGNFAWEKIIVKYDEVLDKLSQSKIKA